MNICFLSSARYSNPLDATTAKKFQTLLAVGDMFVIGFSNTLRPRRFTQHAHFWTLPELPVALLRYMLFFLVAPLLCFGIIFRYRIGLIVAQGPYEGAAAACAKIAAGWFGRRVILIIENHGDFEESLFMQRRVILRRFYRVVMTVVARFALRYADLLRAVSNTTRQQLERWRPGCHVFQFVAWTDIDPFFAAGQSRKKIFSPAILYAGVLIPRKGVIHLINAFARLANDFPALSLRIVGKDDNPSYTKELKARVAACDLRQRVTFVDAVPQQTLARFMEEAGIFALPSYSEGLPRVIYEAMAAGLPVIATNVSGIPEVVRDGVTGFLVPPGDEDALAEKIRWMLEHAEQSVKMGQEAYLAAQALFSTEYWLNNYRQIFNAAQALLDGNASQ